MALEPRNRQEEWYQEMIDAIGEGGSSGLPEVTSADVGEVLTVNGDGTWGANFPDNSDRRIMIDATLGNDGNLTTAQTISYGMARMLFGGCYLYVDIYDTDSQLIERVQMHPISQNNIPAYLFYEGQYVDVLSTSAKRFVAYFAVPNSEDASTTVYLQWKSNKFIVTLTPTAQDFSGTMDKTVGEINAAYEAGQEIVARITTGNGTHLDVPLDSIEVDAEVDYPSFGFQTIKSGAIVVAWTGTTSDGTKATYATNVYTLTPAT